MKKIISALLVMAMLLTSCVLFSSCAGLSAKDFENDTYTAINKVTTATLERFFSDDSGMKNIVNGALKSGSVSFKASSDTLVPDVDLELEETVYFKEMNGIVSDTAITVDGETLNALIFADKNGIILKSEELLGSDTAYAINLNTLVEKFEDSDLGEMLKDSSNMTKSEIRELVEALENFKKEYQALYGRDAEKNNAAFVNELYAAMDMDVSEAKISVGKNEVDGITVAFTVDNDALEEIAEKIIEKSGVTGDAEDSATESVEQLLASFELDLYVELQIEKGAGTLANIIIEGDVKSEAASAKMDIEGEIEFTDSEIGAYFEIKSGDTKYSAELVIEKTKKDEKTVYELELSVGDGRGGEINYLNAYYSYNKSNEKFELGADVYAGSYTDRYELVLDGTVKVTDRSATVALKSLEIGGEEYEANISVTFNKSASAPSAPAKTKDIIDMTEKDLEKLTDDVMNAEWKDIFAAFNKLSGTYSYESYGAEVSYRFERDRVYCTVEMLGTTETVKGTYTIIGSSIIFDFEDDDLDATSSFEKRNDCIYIDGACYKKK